LESVHEVKELCSSGDPQKVKLPRQLEPLTSKGYPHADLSFVTRSGITTKIDDSAGQTESNFYRSGSCKNASYPMSVVEEPNLKN
jgi:hypothetical protein